MPIYLAVLALQVYCVVDVIRRGRNSIWIMALIFLPVASAVAYFIVEILPALQLYTDVMERLPGDEARCRCAALLLKLGRKPEARRVLEDVEHRMKYLDRYTCVSEAPMYDWAMRELTGLRT